MSGDLTEVNMFPLLKKHSLYIEILKHLHPISNFVYVSKVIEYAVDSQMTNYMTVHS